MAGRGRAAVHADDSAVAGGCPVSLCAQLRLALGTAGHQDICGAVDLFDAVTDAERFREALDASSRQRPPPRFDADAVHKVVKRYAPQGIAPAVWERIAPFVRSAVEEAALRTPTRPGALMSTVTHFVAWCRANGLPLEVGVVFHPDTIDRYVVETRSANGLSASNFRNQLRQVGEVVLGPGLYPPKPLSIAGVDKLRPYTDAELSGLVSWAAGLPTPMMRGNVRVLLTFGTGAGLASEEISRLVGSDVEVAAERVTVVVRGAKARRVPMLSEWGSQAAEFVQSVGDRPVFLPQRDRPKRNDISNFVDRCRGDSPPFLRIDRLRATWIVHHLRSGTRLDVLAAAAGVQASNIGDYAPYVEPLPDDEAERQLRGAAP